MIKYLRRAILSTFLITNSIFVEAQIELSTPPMDQSIDSTIRYGILPNGFSYFIKALKEPEPVINLNFYVKVGTDHQTAYEHDFAHGIEHLAFIATENFPLGIHNSKEIEKYNLRIDDFSGSSGPKFTEYYFNVPAKIPEAINTGLLWFQDIAQGIKLSDKDIKQAKGELRQEFFLRTGNDLSSFYSKSNLQSKLFPCLSNYSNYLEHIDNFKPETLRQFYGKRYKPDLMGLSIIGNIEDIDGLEKKVIKIFSELESSNKKNTTNCELLYLGQEPKFIVVDRSSDSLKRFSNSYSQFHLYFQNPFIEKNEILVPNIKHLINFQFLTSLANARLQETTQEYLSFKVHSNESFISGNSPPVLEVVFTVEGNKEKQAMEKTLEVLLQLQKYGISKKEWENLKDKKLKDLAYLHENSIDYWNHEIERLFLFGEPLPCGKYEKMEKWLKEYSLEEFNIFIQKFLFKKPKDIGIIAPYGHDALNFKEKEVRTWIDDTYRKIIEPYEQPVLPDYLMSPETIHNLEIGNYIDNGIDETGSINLVLKNGLKVVIKNFIPSTGLGKKEIKLHGFTLKGARNFPKEEYYSTISAPAIIRNSGVNGLNKFKVNRFLSQKTAGFQGVFPYVDEIESGVYAEALMEDFEIMMQLVYLHFTTPNKDLLAYEDWKQMESLKYNLQTSDDLAINLNNNIRTITGDNSVGQFLGRRAPKGAIRLKGAENSNFKQALDNYINLFENAKDFIFIISGELDLELVLPIIQKYLGNLPNADNHNSVLKCNEKNNILSGPLYVEIPEPEDQKLKNIYYTLKYIKEAENPQDWKKQIKIESLVKVTGEKAWSLRFEKGLALYNIGVFSHYNADLKRYEISSSLEIVPEEFDEVKQELMKVFYEIKEGNILQQTFNKGMADMYSKYGSQKALQHNTIHQNLYNHYRFGQPWTNIDEVENFVKSLTIDDLVKTANEIYKKEYFYEFVMKDENFK